MAQRRILLPWDSQPQEAVEIDWRNPITLGLRFAWTGLSPDLDLVSGLRLRARGSPSRQPTSYGLAQYTTAAQTGHVAATNTSAGFSALQYEATAPPLTVASYMQNTASAGNQTRGVSRPNGSGPESWAVGLWKGSYNGAYGAVRTVDGVLDFHPSTDEFDTTTQPRLVTLAVGPTTTNLYCDATARSGATPTGNFFYQYNDDDRCLNVGASYKAGNQNTFVGFGAVWHRELSKEEHEYLAYNPWQLFAPRSIYIPVSAGGASPTADLTGTAKTATEADVVAGGKTVILTITGDTLVAAGAAFDAIRQDIIDGIDSASAEAHGWDAEVKAKQGVSGVVRTSDTVVTITLDAQAAYDITATETMTATIPASALVLASPILATPAFSISHTVIGGTVPVWARNSSQIISGALL